VTDQANPAEPDAERPYGARGGEESPRGGGDAGSSPHAGRGGGEDPRGGDVAGSSPYADTAGWEARGRSTDDVPPVAAGVPGQVPPGMPVLVPPGRPTPPGANLASPGSGPGAYGAPGHGGPGSEAARYGPLGSGVAGHGVAPGYGRPAPVATLPRDTWRAPTRIEPVPGTPFALGYLSVPPAMSGMAVGSLVAGIASVLISFLVACFGLVGAGPGWGAWVAGAFAVLAVVIGAAGIGLGLAGMHQIRKAGPAAGIRGRGLAIAGLVCGAAGVAVTGLAFVTVLLLQVG
jgi:hypothetical protein